MVRVAADDHDESEEQKSEDEEDLEYGSIELDFAKVLDD